MYCRPWETELASSGATKETKIDALTALGLAQEDAYIAKLKVLQEQHTPENQETYTSAVNALKTAAQIYAIAIKGNARHAAFHYRLGLVLEEATHLKDLFEPPKTKSTEAGGKLGTDGIDDDDDEFEDLPDGTFDQGSSINKEDDIRAICVLHGVSKGASVAAVLKALDEEYHHLKEVGNFTKADYVQGLYSWKSRQAKSIQKPIAGQIDPEGPLARAALKYLDACSIDQTSRE